MYAILILTVYFNTFPCVWKVRYDDVHRERVDLHETMAAFPVADGISRQQNDWVDICNLLMDIYWDASFPSSKRMSVKVVTVLWLRSKGAENLVMILVVLVWGLTQDIYHLAVRGDPVGMLPTCCLCPSNLTQIPYKSVDLTGEPPFSTPFLFYLR